MVDLERQLADYGEFLDEEQGIISPLDILEEPAAPAPVAVAPVPLPWWRRLDMGKFWIGAAAGAVLVILLALILRFLEAMAEFPKTWALFQGGPGSATETIPVYIFLTTWQYFDVSRGAAMSYVVLVLMVIIVLMAIKVLQREKRSLDTMYSSNGGQS